MGSFWSFFYATGRSANELPTGRFAFIIPAGTKFPFTRRPQVIENKGCPSSWQPHSDRRRGECCVHQKKGGTGARRYDSLMSRKADGSNSSGLGITRDWLDSRLGGKRPFGWWEASESGGPCDGSWVELAKQGHVNQVAIAFLTAGSRRSKTL